MLNAWSMLAYAAAERLLRHDYALAPLQANYMMHDKLLLHRDYIQYDTAKTIIRAYRPRQKHDPAQCPPKTAVPTRGSTFVKC